MLAVAARLILILAWTTFLHPTRSASFLVNRTIDDEHGDSLTGAKPTYEPDDGWARGAECKGCNINPTNVDVSKPFDHTWHDSTYHPGEVDRVINVTFKGTAVYVYNLIANTLPGTTTLTNLSFFLDDVYVDQYVHPPDDTSTIMYQQVVYQNATLSNAQHTLSMRANGPNASLILFDYVIYTAESLPTNTTSLTPSGSTRTVPSPLQNSTDIEQPSQPPGNANSSVPIGTIVGGSVGGGMFLLLAAVGIWIWYLRRRPSRTDTLSTKIDPFRPERNISNLPPPQAARRHSRIPNLHIGRGHRIPPVPGSDITNSTSSSSAPFMGHRPRLPPISAAETDRRNQEDLVLRIQALENHMRALEAEQQSSSTRNRSGRQEGGSGSSNPSASRGGRSRSQTPHRTGVLRTELTSLRNEIAELRSELEHDQRLLLEAAPLYTAR